jgi:hypothetical protein
MARLPTQMTTREIVAEVMARDDVRSFMSAALVFGSCPDLSEQQSPTLRRSRDTAGCFYDI